MINVSQQEVSYQHVAFYSTETLIYGVPLLPLPPNSAIALAAEMHCYLTTYPQMKRQQERQTRLAEDHIG